MSWQEIGEDYVYTGELPPHTRVTMLRRGTTKVGRAPAYCVKVEQGSTHFFITKLWHSTPRACWIHKTAKKHAEEWIHEETSCQKLTVLKHK